MKTCVITGASGLLGREVAAALRDGWKLVPLSHRPREGFRAIDLRDPVQIEALVRETRPDAVLHLAACREPDWCEDHPEETRLLNVEPLRHFASLLSPAAQILLVSTDYVFDGRNPPYAEGSPRSPISEYGRSKCAAEDLLAARPRSIALRVPLLIGAGPTFRESGFIAQAVESITSGQPQFLDDVLVRYPCWTRDVAGAIALLVGGTHEGVFHLSGPRRGTRYTWTVEIASMLGLGHAHLRPSVDVVPRRAGRPLDSHLDDTKLRGLGYRAATDPLEVAQLVLAQFPDTGLPRR